MAITSHAIFLDIYRLTNKLKGEFMLKKAKLINIPVEYIEKYQYFKTKGYTSLSLSSFIIEATRKALDENRDDDKSEVLKSRTRVFITR